MHSVSYEDRVRSQIEQYASTINIHELPESFHIWSNDFIRPGLEYVFGTGSIDEAYAMAYVEAMAGKSGEGRILSIGCGDGSVEIRVCRLLLERGCRNFRLTAIDLSQPLLARFAEAARQEGLVSFFDIRESDVNDLRVDGAFDMIMANHSLHHVLNLESLFDFIAAHLSPKGIFATCDMIGRNGHMRWPEAAAFVHALWPILDPRKKYHAQLQRLDEVFRDHDCSGEGFEGIRAQDILQIALDRLHPYRFMGAGGFVDMFVDRGYGHGFDVGKEADVALVRTISMLNDILLDAKVITPTWTMAHFTLNDRGERFYRDRRAIDSVRRPSVAPNWTRFYDAIR